MEELKAATAVLETKIPVNKSQIIQMRAAKRDIKSKLAGKRKQYKRLLAEIKQLKPREKVGRTFLVRDSDNRSSRKSLSWCIIAVFNTTNSAVRLYSSILSACMTGQEKDDKNTEADLAGTCSSFLH